MFPGNPTYTYALNLKIFFQVASGLGIILFYFYQKRLEKFQDYLNKSWKIWLLILSTVYFATTFLSKYSQEKSLLFAGQDFWLFVDMFRSMAKGEPYITRFTEMGLGPVQHGAVHAYLTAYIAVPLVWLFGSLNTAIIFNPLMLALSGLVLGFLTFRMSRSPAMALLFPIGFWMSEWTNRLLNYEVHPESAYPLFVFAVVLISFEERYLRNIYWWIGFFLLWVGLVGIKQDGLAIAGLVLIWLFYRKNLNLKEFVFFGSTIFATAIFVALIIKNFKSGQIGLHHISIGSADNVGVKIPTLGSGVLGGQSITGIQSIKTILDYFCLKNGGISSWLLSSMKYFFKDPFLSFTAIAPWIWLGWAGWILVFPMALLFALVGDHAAGLQEHYSAPLIGLIWVAILFSLNSRKKYKSLWVLGVCAFYGGTAITLYSPESNNTLILKEAREVSEKMPGLGIVSSRLLSSVSLDRVWTDRLDDFSVKENFNFPPYVRWILFPAHVPSYELPEEVYLDWKKFVSENKNWRFIPLQNLDLYERVK